MLETMTETGPKLKASRIDEAEKSLGKKFPKSYRDFLLKYNGGRPIPPCFPIEGFSEDPYGECQCILGIDVPEESSNILWSEEVLRDRLPTHLLPIALTPVGDILCLSYARKNKGAVVFCDMLMSEGYEVTEEHTYPVAASFEEFLNSLVVSDSDDAKDEDEE